MIPFRDDVPSRTTPVATILLIVANVAIFLYQLTLSPVGLEQFFLMNGVIPERFDLASGSPVASLLETTPTLFSSMFLHGGWLHLLGNMLYLWIFGDNVEDRMGHLRFLFFYAFCGLAAGIAHILFNLSSPLPSIGASGAVAGVLGAYLLCYPFARVRTLIPLFLIWPIVELPALIVLGSWFVIQVIQGTAALGGGELGGGIAWWAHVGGFVTGMLMIGVFARPVDRRYRWELEA